MTLRPCVQCGEPSSNTRCPAHRLPHAPKVRERGHLHTNTATWKTLSSAARKAQPWCTWCGAVDDLCTDHIIPYSIAPELGHCIENCQVLCRTCNGTRGNHFTAEEARSVLTRLQTAYDRRPTRSTRERLSVAQRALQTRGMAPQGQQLRPVGKAQSALHTPRGYVC